MPFEYQQYRNPYVTTIADLMQRQSDVQAQRDMVAAQAQADAARQSGQAWAGAVSNIGQILGSLPMQAIQLQEQQQQVKQRQQALDIGALQLKQAQARDRFLADFSQTLKDTPQIDEGNGTFVADVPTITQAMNAKGHGQFTGDIAKELDGLNTAFRNAGASRLAAVRQGALALQAGGNDPRLANTLLDLVEKNQLYPKDQVDQMRQMITDDPSSIPKLSAFFAGPPKLMNLPEGATAINENTGQPVFAAPKKPGEGDYTINGQRFKADGTPIGPAVAKEPTNEFEAFMATAAKAAGAARFADLTPEQQQEAYDKYAATKSGQETVTIKTVDASGKPIERVMTRADALKQGVFTSQPPASVQVRNIQQGQWDSKDVEYWADQVQRDASKYNLMPTSIRELVAHKLADSGLDINKISESSRGMAEMAKELIPHMPRVMAEAQVLQDAGLFGPLGSRWREFVTGKLGSADLLTGGRADQVTSVPNPVTGKPMTLGEVVGKFKADVGLMQTGTNRAHGGTRGGGSPTMLAHMHEMLNADKVDLNIFKGELLGFQDWMQGYSQMLPDKAGTTKATGVPTTAPAGFTDPEGLFPELKRGK